MDVRRLLEQWGLRPSKGLGQNFLVDQAALERIVAAAELTPDDIVLEVGAGLGTLTRRLAQNAGHVVAVELDQRLIPVLRSVLADFDNVTLVQGDILSLDPVALIGAANLQSPTPNLQSPTPNLQYKVVANLPYYITSAVLRHLLEANLKPQRMVVTVQREVAERIVAQPGQMSLLAVSVQFYGRPQLLFRIKPGSFYPPPEVESAVVRVDLHAAPSVPVGDTDTFFRVVRAGFAQRRKQLRNALAAGLGLSPEEAAARLREVGVDPRRRAQTLSLEEWARIVRALGTAAPRAFPKSR
ncbi:MAG TPA: 16S rRNA (adenine(1518)-N(6)/adenine(1519)-N(6))-dimethyltransferase RsmA [Thermoflexia bacterium]|nr:16S rRNA (adenine(1518)-N(6)/adenine(1519)-N(6))-dimethyltransferase RsmA [Thermoflexia bacterium]